MYGVSGNRSDGKFIERVAGHARSPLGELEYAISSQLHIDLFEVKRWPITKKLVYQEHMAAAQERAEAERDIEGDGFDPNSWMAGGTDQKSLMRKARRMAKGGSSGPKRSKNIHPKLAQYNTVVDVVGEDDE